MDVELVSLVGVKYSGMAYEVIIPTADGEISVFPHHMPLISMSVPGVLSIRKHKEDPDNTLEHFASLGGVVEIMGNTVRILVDEVEHADEIYESEAREAFERAKVLKEQAKTAVELAHAQQVVDRQATRLKVAELRRHSRRR